MSNHKRRRKFFVEPRMQGLLVFKILLYWINAFLTMGLLLAVWTFFMEAPRTSLELCWNVWQGVGPAMLASLVLLPIILWDSVRWSNRYAGPMLRLHDSLRALADGQDVRPLNFRKGDLWFEMAEQFNRVAARQQNTQPDVRETPQEADHAAELAEPVAV